MKARSLLIFLVVFILALSGCELAPAEETEPTEYVMPASLFTTEDFKTVDGKLVYTGGNALMGIDVSSHQGQVNWTKVAASGVKFAFVRLGYRAYGTGELFEDSYAMANLQGAKAAGIAVGAYFFSQAISVEEAREEANYALEILDGFSLDLPLVYDWEYVNETARSANVDRRTLTDCTLAFCARVAREEYEPMVYFNTNQALDRLYMQELEQFPWWLAKYDHSVEFVCRVDLWQYTNQGTLPGISGKVDINLMFTDYGIGADFSEQLH